jgi:hypothetical protein
VQNHVHALHALFDKAALRDLRCSTLPQQCTPLWARTTFPLKRRSYPQPSRSIAP